MGRTNPRRQGQKPPIQSPHLVGRGGIKSACIGVWIQSASVTLSHSRKCEHNTNEMPSDTVFWHHFAHHCHFAHQYRNLCNFGCSSPWFFSSIYVHTYQIFEQLDQGMQYCPNTSSGHAFGGSHTFGSCISPHDTLCKRIYYIPSEDKSFGHKVSLWIKRFKQNWSCWSQTLVCGQWVHQDMLFFFPPPNHWFHITSSSTNHTSGSTHNAWQGPVWPC